MDSFELNKVLGAVLGTVFVVFSVSLVSDAIFSWHAPETPGYAIVASEDGGASAGSDSGGAPESVLPLLASADAANGASIFKRCAACHTDDKSGANKVGPNLWGVVDRPVASHEGFSYSAGMQAFAEGGKTWTYENLDHFIANPKGFVPGTAMAFAGLKKVKERADLIAYLREQADSPAPLPEVGAEGEAGPAEEAAPAEQAAPAEEAPAAEQAPATEAAPADNDGAATEQGAAPQEEAAPETDGGNAEEAPAQSAQ